MIAAERVAAVLLAAGLSRRFGPEDKLLADLDGKPLAVHAADTLAGIGFGSLIAVCSADPVADLLAARGFTIVRNERPEDGQSRSIRLGVEAAGDAETVLIALADMPFVGAAHYRRLLAAHEDVTASSPVEEPRPTPPFPSIPSEVEGRTGPDALRPSTSLGMDGIGNAPRNAETATVLPPALFGRAYFESLRKLSGNRGARTLLGNAALVEAVAAELTDIDTRAALIPPRPAPSG